MSDLGVTIEQAIGEAIEASIGQHEGGFVLKWVALVETLGPDGSRGMWTATSDDATVWDSLGMLTYAVAREQAAIIHPADDEDDD